MIKKRVIISIILTLLAVWGSHNYWLTRKPIDIAFNIQGENIEQVEVQLNKHNSDNFKKCYYQKSEGEIKNNAHLKFSFKKPFAPKRLKLLRTLSPAKGGGALYGLNLRDGKRKLNDLENFSAQGADLKIENNKLFFKPKQNQFSITYDKNLNVRASIKFDILVLLIITIVTYLVAFKFTSYLADFKINKNKSRIDIVFLAIFFLIMFIPMMRISNEKTSKSENRNLATYKPLFKTKGGLNFNYGKDFDKWFSDRFNLRDKIIFVQHQTNYKIRTDYVSMNNKSIFKSNGYIIHNYPNTFTPFTDKELELYSYNLNKFNEFCEANSIKLYIVIPPASNSYCKKHILTFNTMPEDRIIKLKNYARQKYNLDIIYPEKELRDNENDELVYFKTDHHWTDIGAYIIYKELISKMKTNLPLLRITPINEFHSYKNTLIRADYQHKFTLGGEYKQANIKAPELLKTEYIYYDYKYPQNIIITGGKEHFTHINRTGHYKLLILGDSYMENLTYFLNTSFYKIEKYRTNMDNLKKPKRKYELEIKAYENIIKKFKPDAIILIKHSGTMDSLKDMYPQEDN